jgi:YD repeat-containing protein
MSQNVKAEDFYWWDAGVAEGYWSDPQVPGKQFPNYDDACEYIRVTWDKHVSTKVTPGNSTVSYFAPVYGVPSGVYSNSIDNYGPSLYYCTIETTSYYPNGTLWGAIQTYVRIYRKGLGCTAPKVFNQATGRCELPADNPKNSPGNQCSGVGHPINRFTGNKYLDETDVAPAGASPLQFIRHYNSKPAYFYQTITGSGIARAAMGMQWFHNYYRGLSVSASQVNYVRPDRQTFVFRLVSGGWQAEADVDYRLEELLSGTTRTGWKITTPTDTVEIYGPGGIRLRSITDHSGRTQTFTYSCTTVSASCPVVTPTSIASAAGLLIRVTDYAGRSLNFTYNLKNQLITLTDPAGNVTRYSYDADDNLATVTYPDATPSITTDNPKKTYVYGELAYTANVSQPHALTGILDEHQVRYATYRYDASGKAVSTEHAGGVDKYQLTYATNSTSVTDPLNSVYTTSLQAVQGVLKPTGQSQPGGSGCAASASALGYDANGNVARRTDFNGNVSCYKYDLSRNLETVRLEGLAPGSSCPADLSAYTPPAGSPVRKISTQWHPTFRLPVKVTEPGLETTSSYNAQGEVTLKSLKDLATEQTRTWSTAYTYSTIGSLLSRTEDGPRTDVADLTVMDYYPPDAACTGGHLGCRGQLQQLTRPGNQPIRITRYSANGQPEEVIDPNGLVTTLTYDARQRLVSQDVGGEVTTYRYDPTGLLSHVAWPGGATLDYRYDDAHRLAEVEDQAGNTATYTLDALGNRTQEAIRDPGGQLVRSQSRVYDALSRLQHLIQTP